MKETKRTIKVSEHIRLDTRPGSAKWQARVKLADGSWHRFSTKTESIERATEVAMKFFYTSEDRLKNNLPQSTRKFRRVAEFARDRMQEELRSGSGHIVYKDYITALDKYLIPFFGSFGLAFRRPCTSRRSTPGFRTDKSWFQCYAESRLKLTARQTFSRT